MNFDEYQELARRTQSKEMTYNDMLYHALFGMCSELGEIHSIFQHFYQGEGMDGERKAALVSEAGDLLWFLSEFCDALSITMDDIANANINKLRRRYPYGFDVERSAHRHEIEKDVK